MLGIQVLDGATVECAGALVAREQAAARRVRPELPAAFDSPGVCAAALQRLCDSGHPFGSFQLSCSASATMMPSGRQA